MAIQNKCIFSKNKDKELSDRLRDMIMEEAGIIEGRNVLDESNQLVSEETLKAAVRNLMKRNEIDKFQKALEVLKIKESIDDIDKMVASGLTTAEAMKTKLDVDLHGKASDAGKRLYSEKKKFETLFLDDIKNVVAVLRDESNHLDFVKEMDGISTNNKLAKQAAEVWREASENMRQTANSTGIIINKLEDWKYPQSHDADKLLGMGKTKWIEYILPKVDRSKMSHPDGMMIKDEKDLTDALESVYDSITTGGRNKIDVLDTKRLSSKLGDKRNQERFLIFKDGESALEYNKQFGQRDLGVSIFDHTRTLANDIAIANVMGPNPDKTLKVWQNILEEKGFDTEAQRIQSIYNNAAGKDVGVADPVLAEYHRGVTGFIQSAIMGSTAWTSYFGDNLSIMTTMNEMGIRGTFESFSGDQFIKSAMGMFERDAKKWTDLDKEVAKRSAFTLDGILWDYTSGNRFDDSFNGMIEHTGHALEGADKNLSAKQLKRRQRARKFGDTGAKSAEAIYRISGQTKLTRSLKNQVGNQFLQTLSAHKNIDWAKLEPKFKKHLEIAGFNDKIWNQIKDLKPQKINGLETLTLNDFKKLDLSIDENDELMSKLFQWISEGTRFAIQEPTARINSKLRGANSQKGEAGRLFADTAFMLKKFPAVALPNLIARGRKGGVTPVVTALATSTLAGYFIMNSGLILNGNEPVGLETMADNPKLMLSAVTKGGGLGFLGDLLLTDFNEYGHDVRSWVSGPAGGFAQDTIGLGTKLVKSGLTDEEQHFGDQVINYFDRYLPASNLWYTKLIKKHLITNELKEWNDSKKFKKTQKKREKNLKKDFNSKSWID